MILSESGVATFICGVRCDCCLGAELHFSAELAASFALRIYQDSNWNLFGRVKNVSIFVRVINYYLKET